MDNFAVRSASVAVRSASVAVRSASVAVRSASVAVRSASVAVRSASVAVRSASVAVRSANEACGLRVSLRLQVLDHLYGTTAMDGWPRDTVFIKERHTSLEQQTLSEQPSGFERPATFAGAKGNNAFRWQSKGVN